MPNFWLYHIEFDQEERKATMLRGLHLYSLVDIHIDPCKYTPKNKAYRERDKLNTIIPHPHNQRYAGSASYIMIEAIKGLEDLFMSAYLRWATTLYA